MDLSKIFTKKNIEILKLLDRENLHIRDIAERLKCSPAKVHDSIKLFKKHDFIIETKDKNKIIIKLNKNNQLLKNIENLIKNEFGKQGIKEVHDRGSGRFRCTS